MSYEKQCASDFEDTLRAELSLPALVDSAGSPNEY